MNSKKQAAREGSDQIHPGAFADLAAPAAVLCAPFLVFVGHHAYPFWTLEILFALALIATAGLTIGAAIRLRPTGLRPVVFLLLLVVAIDLQFGLGRLIVLYRADMVILLRDHGWMIFIAVPLAVFALLALFVLLREKLSPIVLTVFAVIGLSNLLLPRLGTPSAAEQTGVPVATALPPVIHLILDEHIGIDGFPSDLPETQALRKDLAALLQSFGFVSFDRAFSHYSRTEASLANQLNGRAGAVDGANLARRDGSFLVADNAYFEELSRRGYAVRVYQSDHLDFCALSPIRLAGCLTYAANGPDSLAITDIDGWSKAKVLLSSYLGTSAIYTNVRLQAVAREWVATERQSGQAGYLERGAPKLGALRALEILERASEDIRGAARGTAFFLHLLAPHYAYVLGPECQAVRDTAGWLNRTSLSAVGNAINSPASRARRYRGYTGQVACVAKRLAAFLGALEDDGILEDATVVIQGDHGSRIALHDPVASRRDELTDEDLRDSFSTLFALRRPGLTPGSDKSMRSIQALFAELMLEAPLEAEHRRVYLRPDSSTAGSTLATATMPAFDAAPGE